MGADGAERFLGWLLLDMGAGDAGRFLGSLLLDVGAAAAAGFPGWLREMPAAAAGCFGSSSLSKNGAFVIVSIVGFYVHHGDGDV